MRNPRREPPYICREELAALACTLDCRYVVIDCGGYGVILSVVFRDSFCEEPPGFVIEGCIVVDEEGVASELEADKVLYAYKAGRHVVVATECDLLASFYDRLRDTVKGVKELIEEGCGYICYDASLKCAWSFPEAARLITGDYG